MTVADQLRTLPGNAGHKRAIALRSRIAARGQMHDQDEDQQRADHTGHKAGEEEGRQQHISDAVR